MKQKFKQTEIGLIPEDWEIKTIEDIGEVIGGGTPSTKEESYYGGDIAWITPKDLSNYDPVFISKGERSITKEGLKNSSAKLMPKGTVLFTSRAPIGYVVIANNDVCTNQGFKSIICKKNIDNKFIYYWLKFNKRAIENRASGSTFKEVSGSVLKLIKIALPNYQEQQAISKILFDLDSKIEFLQKQNETLENIGKSIFKQWFVDFEFPNEKGKPYKSSGGKMVESEMGWIPKEWEVETLGNIITNYDSKRVPLSSMERKKKQGIYRYYGATKIMDYVDGFLFDGTYLLMAEDGSVTNEQGYPVLQYVNGQFWVSNHAHVIQGKICSTEFIYLLLVKMNIEPYVTGAVQPKLNQANMNSIQLVFPTEEILNRGDRIIKNLFSRRLISENEILSLQKTRDLLLPKLMSGRIRIPIEVRA